MFDVKEKPQQVERAFLITVFPDKEAEPEAKLLLNELKELVETLGIGVIGTAMAKVSKTHARYLTGTGKAAELIAQAKELQADVIIFDNELTPAQQRAWEGDSKIAVIDRQEVILDIFNMRARSREAQLQVQLARMEYALPRLTRMWGHLDRQGGSGPAARGEGETQLEVDKRLARERISRVREELAEVKKQRATQRKERVKEGLPHVAIVGYTNAGKSSLLNALTGAEAFVKDQVFATLDTTTRRLELPDGQTALITDTVGFIRNLPHKLVESFKATLEEAVQADFLIHVLDASDPEVYTFYDTTLKVLGELGAADKGGLVVLNKIDLITDASWRHQLERHFDKSVFISVKTGEGLESLQLRLNELLFDRVVRLHLRVPLSRSDLLSLIHREGKTLSTDYEGNDARVQAVIPKKLLRQFEPFIDPEPPPPPEPPVWAGKRGIG